MGTAPAHAVHPFDPVWDAGCRVLVLGTFPSVRSREVGFYYGHPRNRFWPMLARIFGGPVPADTQGRRDFALRCGVALWDVLAACDIAGSSDASIRRPVPNDVAALALKSGVRLVACNGRRAYELYRRYIDCPLPVRALPSTSAANAAWSLDALCGAWREALL